MEGRERCVRESDITPSGVPQGDYFDMLLLKIRFVGDIGKAYLEGD